MLSSYYQRVGSTTPLNSNSSSSKHILNNSTPVLLHSHAWMSFVYMNTIALTSRPSNTFGKNQAKDSEPTFVTSVLLRDPLDKLTHIPTLTLQRHVEEQYQTPKFHTSVYVPPKIMYVYNVCCVHYCDVWNAEVKFHACMCTLQIKRWWFSIYSTSSTCSHRQKTRTKMQLFFTGSFFFFYKQECFCPSNLFST